MAGDDGLNALLQAGFDEGIEVAVEHFLRVAEISTLVRRSLMRELSST
jgi:hypothetical protein